MLQVKLRRIALGMTLDTLARIAGVHKNTISRIENGDPPTGRTLRKIARALGVSESDLLNETTVIHTPTANGG